MSDCPLILWSTPLARLSLYVLTLAKSTIKVFFPRAFVKIFRGNSLAVRLPEMGIRVVARNRINKCLKGKSGE